MKLPGNQSKNAVCTLCWTLLRLSTEGVGDKMVCKTTVANNHKAEKHPDTKEAQQASARQAAAQQQRESSLFNFGMAGGVGKSIARLSPKDSALSSQAHFFVYGRSSVSMSNFDDPKWREMHQAQYASGFEAGWRAAGGQGTRPKSSAACITRHGLKHWVRAEFAVQIRLFK